MKRECNDGELVACERGDPSAQQQPQLRVPAQQRLLTRPPSKRHRRRYAGYLTLRRHGLACSPDFDSKLLERGRRRQPEGGGGGPGMAGSVCSLTTSPLPSWASPLEEARRSAEALGSASRGSMTRRVGSALPGGWQSAPQEQWCAVVIASGRRGTSHAEVNREENLDQFSRPGKGASRYSQRRWSSAKHPSRPRPPRVSSRPHRPRNLSSPPRPMRRSSPSSP